MSIIQKIFGSHSARELKKIEPVVQQIELLEQEYKNFSDAQLKAKTAEFKNRLQNGETLDDILPEAFATIREAADRVLGMRPFRVQLIGGIVLHQGRIAEMKTGEGKTLVATLPAYLNSLTGNGVHVITVNDYLSSYQSEWMGKVYRFLGLTVGLIVHGVSGSDRRNQYLCDITYGTNNEFGFDYLRDNMALYKNEMVQRGHVFAVVDEVDSILIDEARTPLIISGQGDKSTDMYVRADVFVAKLRVMRVTELNSKEEHEDYDSDYIVDEKSRTATLTPHGVEKAEKYFNIENLTDSENTTLLHHINQSLRARGVMKLDTDYVVNDGQVIIVDEFTGRKMYGRRYSEGLHQAIEAKEGVKIERESKTLATITFQNYFRLYAKLSGMTGTALTEEEEFGQIYKLDIIEIPTNRPLAREDLADAVYKTVGGKTRAMIAQIKECNQKGQPVLVGTVSIEKSEQLSAILKKEGVKHVVLNAKHHEKEAEIVAQAGHIGAVTIATNMAGRGTDIMLGGNAEYLARSDMHKAGIPDEIIAEATGYADTDNQEILDARTKFGSLLEKYKASISIEADKVREAGGLFIIGTERHESRRIDNQLRGRAGRQGDPGSSRFYISMEDDLMRLFGTERIQGILNTLGLDEDTPIDQKILSNAIENSQKRVESRHFQSRKTVLQYDDVLNKQREIIYGQRKKVLDGEDLRTYIVNMIESAVESSVKQITGEQNYIEPIQAQEIITPWEGVFLAKGEGQNEQFETPNDLTNWLKSKSTAVYQAKEQAVGEIMRELERVVLLRSVDEKWMAHIDDMHELRQGINLRAFAQTDPVVEYKREGFSMFDAMIESIRTETVRLVYIAQIRGQDAPKREQVAKGAIESIGGDGTVKKQPVRKTVSQKTGPNDPCPCGSGKKYKKCCYLNKTNNNV